MHYSCSLLNTHTENMKRTQPIQLLILFNFIILVTCRKQIIQINIFQMSGKLSLSIPSLISFISRTPSPVLGDKNAPTASIPEDSSDSENETEPARVFHRRLSTNKNLNKAVRIQYIDFFSTTKTFFFIFKALSVNCSSI